MILPPLEPSRYHLSLLQGIASNLAPTTQPVPAAVPNPKTNMANQPPTAPWPAEEPLPKEVPTPPNAEAGVLGVPKERLPLPLPTAPGTGVLCPKVGAGVPGKQHNHHEPGSAKRKNLAFGGQEAQISPYRLK